MQTVGPKIPFLDLRRQITHTSSQSAARVLTSGWYINGPELQSFEQAFAAFCGTTHCVGTANGTDSLELALRAAGVQPNDEVATVANAGMYSTTAIRAIGAVPLLVDVEPVNLLMSPESLADSIGPRTRAVIATHLYGEMSPMDEIIRVASAHGAVVIEDCAQSHGALRQGRRAGSFGIAGCFSFYPTKNLGALGDAGAVVTSDPDFDSRVRALRQYGWQERFCSTVGGGRNSRMDELQAAVLRDRLPQLDAWNRRRVEIAKRYQSALKDCESYVLPDLSCGYVGHLYVLRCAWRDELRRELAARGVEAQVHYPLPDHLQPSQQGLAFRMASLPVTERAARQVLSLPCYPELQDDEIDSVIAILFDIAPRISARNPVRVQ